MRKRMKMLALLAAILGGYAAYHYWGDGGSESAFWSAEGSNTLMGYAILIVYTVTLVASSIYAFIGEKISADSLREGESIKDKSLSICIISCLVSSILLVIWLNNFLSPGSAGGRYAYYINGARVSSGSMIANYSIVVIIFCTAISFAITKFISGIPASIIVSKRNIQESLAYKISCSQDRDECMAAVYKLYDQRLLTQVARNARDKDVRMEAFNKISDQQWLSDVAIYAGDNDVCSEAFNKLFDQQWLSRVAIYGQNKDVSKQAFKKLSDQEWLSSVAQHSRDTSLCIKALEKISDQKWLFDVAKNGRHTEVNIEAVKKITDQQWLCETAKYALNCEVCKEAAKKISGQERLSDIVKNARYSDVKEIATLKLNKLMESREKRNRDE